MKVLVTGAAGFTGSRVVPILLEAGHEVKCFVRPTTKLDRLPHKEIELCMGSLEESDSLALALDGVEVVINLASLGFGHGPNLVDIIKASGVRRAVFVSTTSIFTSLNAPSKEVRNVAENAIRESGLDYTIIRPTMIYGGPDDRNICRLIQFIKRWPIIPIFGSGRYLLQPVFVKDLAAAIVAATFQKESIRREYNLSGADPLTYNDLVMTICRLIGKRRILIHLPAPPIIAFLKIVELLGIKMKIKAEQVQRLNEHKGFSHNEAVKDFGYNPKPFKEGVSLELFEMGVLDNIRA